MSDVNPVTVKSCRKAHQEHSARMHEEFKLRMALVEAERELPRDAVPVEEFVALLGSGKDIPQD